MEALASVTTSDALAMGVSIVAVALSAYAATRTKKMEAAWSVAADARKATFEEEFKIYQELWVACVECYVRAAAAYAVKVESDTYVIEAEGKLAPFEQQRQIVYKYYYDFAQVIGRSAPFYDPDVHAAAKKCINLMEGFVETFCENSQQTYQDFVNMHSRELSESRERLQTTIQDRLDAITTIGKIKSQK